MVGGSRLKLPKQALHPTALAGSIVLRSAFGTSVSLGFRPTATTVRRVSLGLGLGSLTGRMGEGMHFLEPSKRDLCVDLGGRELGMAEDLLDRSQIGPVLQHESGHGVAEEMAGALLAAPGAVDIPSY